MLGGATKLDIGGQVSFQNMVASQAGPNILQANLKNKLVWSSKQLSKVNFPKKFVPAGKHIGPW